MKRIPHIRSIVFISVAALILAGELSCVAQEPPVNAEPQAGFVPGLLPGDQIEVFSTDLTESPDVRLTIGPDGTINFPYIGTVKLEGLTPTEVQTKIADELKEKQIVLKPFITVNVVNARNYAVTVIGEVRTPTRVPLFSAAPLSMIISAAGGFTPNASLHVLISHANGDAPEDVEVSRDLHDLHSLNMTVMPGDVVAVVPAGSYFALGEFNHPGVFQIVGTQHLTLLQAVATAGGPTTLGELSRARLLRTVNGHREEIIFDAGKLERGQIADPLVHTDDIIYIPRNNSKNLTNNWLNTALTLTGLSFSLATFLK